MEISVKGKKALVTGASRGMGRAITEILLKAGASKVYAVDILKDELGKLASEVPNVVPICVDISNWEATESTLSKLEPVDFLVNNAGICWETHPGTIKESDYDKLFSVNTKAIVNITQVISNQMIKAGIQGSIVNISSSSALQAMPKYLIYSSSKAAVDHITHNFAAHLASHGIRVNGINPYSTNTALLAAAIGGDEKIAEAVKRGSALNRFFEPEEIARIVLFLLSDWAGIINGVMMPVDFGHTL